jgi:hypothetical protein
MRRRRHTSYPKLPRARGPALTRLAWELQVPRAGFWEHVPWLGDWLLRRRIRATRLLVMRSEDRRLLGFLFGPKKGA